MERLVFAERTLSAFYQERADPRAVNARTAADLGIPISSGKRQRALLAHLLPQANHLVP